MYRSGLLLLVLSFGCAERRQAAPPVTDGAPASAMSAAPTSVGASVEDPGPRLVRKTGAIKAVVRAPIRIAADGVHRAGGALFIRVPMPPDMSQLLSRLAANARIVVEGERYGLAVPAAEGRADDRPLMFIRLTGVTPPEELALVWHQAADRSGIPGSRQAITVHGVAESTDAPEVVENFWRAASLWFERRGGMGSIRIEAFNAFAAARLRYLAEDARPGGDVARLRQRRRGEIAGAMAFYTGLTSVEEALQADRGLQVRRSERDVPTLPVDSLASVDLPGHPWAKLMAQGGKAPVIEPLAAYVPAEFAYLHFHDLRTFVALAEDVDQLLTPLARTLEEHAGAHHFAQRYERQLALQRSALSKTLGHVAAKGVAVVASDPFFREGTDVSVLFHVRTRAALDTALATYEAAARQRRPDATVTELSIGGQRVRLLATADGEIRQHRLTLGEVLIVSNSRGAITRIIEAHAGTRAALSKSGDFQYFRILYPFGAEAEDGFLFISDAFVQNVVGPRAKILQARRMQARAAVQAAGFTALLHGWLEGRRPASVADLKAAGVLIDGDLKDDLGGPITLDLEAGARSRRWGNAAASTPLIDLDLKTVSVAERDAYERFRQTYQAYWRGFIDPIGARIWRTDEGGLTVDARMLPLIQRSEYNELARTVGKTRVSVPPLGEGLRMSFAVAEDSPLRRTLDGLSRSTTGQRDIGLGWLGDWVMVGVADRGGLWDLALSVGEVPSAGGRSDYRSTERRKSVFDRTPLYVGAHVRDGLALAATLTALRGFVASAAPGLITWEAGEVYRDIATVRIQERVDGDGISLHYAIAKKVLIASLDLATLKLQIDEALDRPAPVAAEAVRDAPGQAQGVVDLRPKPNGWLGRTLLGMLEVGVMNANNAAARAHEALVYGRPGLSGDPDAQRAEAIRWLGFEPISAHGGRFTVGADGLVRHPTYGSEVEPVWPAIPVEGSAAAAFLAGLERLRLTVSYEGERLDRGLHTTLHWSRRPAP